MTPAARQRTLLVIDDDIAICQMLADLASSFGYQTDIACTPEQIDRLVGGGHDLVMLDLSLGETDGMRVMRVLGERQPGANLVLLTGAGVSVLSGAKRVAELSGFNVVGACGKPASITELEAVLQPPDESSVLAVDAAQHDVEMQVMSALDTGSFHLVYQPIVNLQTDEVTGAEALVRLNAPGMERLSPEVWVPMIERAGRTSDLLDVVFRHAAHDRATSIALQSLHTISVNVSVLDLTDTNLPERAERALGLAADPRAWTLEITESAEVERLVDALDVLVRLRLKGFGLSMDDFGSGASTLARLRELPFTSMKADRRYMQTNFDDPDHTSSMLRAAVELGAAMGLKVVAEGVETTEELNMARGVGCDLAQGYLIGRPVRAESFGVLVAAWNLNAANA